KADIGRLVAGDDRARRIDAERRPERQHRAVAGTPAVVERDPLFGFEAAAFVADRTASFARANAIAHTHDVDDTRATRNAPRPFRPILDGRPPSSRGDQSLTFGPHG